MPTLGVLAACFCQYIVKEVDIQKAISVKKHSKRDSSKAAYLGYKPPMSTAAKLMQKFLAQKAAAARLAAQQKGGNPVHRACLQAVSENDILSTLTLLQAN